MIRKCQIPNSKRRESTHHRIKKNSDSSFFNLEKKYLSTYKAQKLLKGKIYYVHSKISQHLHGTTLNKPFKKHSHFWKAHNGPISGLDWNIPSYSHLLVTAGLDAAVQIWNVWSNLNYKLATFTHHKKAVKNVELVNRGSNLLSCSYDCTALVTDVETGKILALCEHADYVTACHGHVLNPHLFISGSENIILMWDSRVPQAPVNHFTYKDKFGQVQDLLFIANGDELVSCTDIVSRDSSDRSILIWDTRSKAVSF
ncbi:WD repeat-containing protein 25-like [Physella acuta]|uniref:WD repeat-containing protein 25-like n=1 Tax=Physella acuta TaxID=109671 RepID=UPI0027DAF189|nr:WD repeat-containing protein 25-like [Physella acuta]